jgi:predicted SnoaL-like aldol condensation-catalyzing enzyme
MTTEESRALAYRVYDAINAQDAGALTRLFDPHIVRHAAGETGIEPAVAAMQRAFAANPARRFRVEDVIAEGDKVTLRVTVLGAPAAPGEPPPLIMEIFRIANGRVAEIWGAGTARPRA